MIVKYCLVIIVSIGAACGFPNWRIVNGKDAVLGQFPHQALLRMTLPYGRSLCGGSLINDRWILTAAHCADGALDVEVSLGILHPTGDSGLVLVSKEYYVHEKYDPFQISDDVALVKLPKAVNFTDNIKPVKLPNGINSSFESETVIASGWGLKKNGGTVANTLQYAPLSIISNQECKMTYFQIIKPTTICAVGPNSESTCNGDSGGPLILEDSQTLVGVTSFGHIMGCESGIAVGFSRVTSYIDWINDHVNKH